MNLKIIFAMVVLLGAFVSVGYAGTEESLSDYTIIVDLKSHHVTHSFNIENNLDMPLVPGRAKLAVPKELGPFNIYVTVGGFKKLITDKVTQGENTLIYYDIWQPVLKGTPLDVVIEFDTDSIEPKGFLFKQVNIDLLEPEVKVNGINVIVIPPAGTSVTYTSLPFETIDGQKIVRLSEVDQQQRVSVEYSVVPLPTLPFQGYWLWLVLLFAAAVFFIYAVRKSYVVTKEEPAPERTE